MGKRKHKGHRSTYLGLNDHGRIMWNDKHNQICITLARLGFSIRTIAQHTGLTECQVIYRCHKKGLSVTEYRNGTSERALSVLNRYTIKANQKTG